ncbi:PSP1 domain-containing protein [Desulfomarina sp.]
MTGMSEEESSVRPETGEVTSYYRIRFREEGQQFSASFAESDLVAGNVVMVNTDHGLEPAEIVERVSLPGLCGQVRRATFEISRPAGDEEREKYSHLAENEARAFSICRGLIEKHELSMQLVRVERFFNGSKMVFYFTADNRVDFRALVKDLVQEFRTRVEMRQVGVRHETKMIGGIGTCGRELCCSSFIKKFDSVSIKMAKEQDLPLNPAKISGVCNRLLCCLTYEYDTYRKQRKGMPRPGKRIVINNEHFRVKRQNPLQETILVENESGEEFTLSRDQWRQYRHQKRKTTGRDRKKKKDRGSSKNN